MTDEDLRVTRIRPVTRAGGGTGNGRGDGNGSGGRGRPPDLGELLRRMMGGGGGGGGGGNTPKILMAVGVLVVWCVFSAFFTVDVSEEGVVTRFGAYNRTTPPGMHLKMPFGIESVIKVQSKRVLQEEFGFRTRSGDGEGPSQYDKAEYAAESLMLTGDLNVADVEWIVQYRIADAWKYLFHARDVRRNVRDVSLSIMRRVVGDRLVGDALTTGRVEIADQAKLLTQEVLDQYDMGIKLERIILQGANPPEKVKPAFNDVNTAKQEQEQTINNAEREYNKVIPEARGKAEQVVADAQAYAIDIENRAKGDAAQFDEVRDAFRKDPDITRRRLYIDAMEDILGKSENITIVDPNIKGLLPLLGGGMLPKTPVPTPTK